MTVDEINKCERTAPAKCVHCGKNVTKWIYYVPIGDLCINCAHTTMRILLQDIIQYHNGKSISLLDVMYHGSKDTDMHRLPRGIKPNGKPEYEKDGEMGLFDFRGNIMPNRSATYYNWNRMAMLSQAGVRSDHLSMVSDEMSMRIDLQNLYSGVKECEIPEALSVIKSTLTPAIIKAVDEFMKGKHASRSR